MRGVDFGAAPGATRLTVRVASLVAGGAVEARLDSVAGALVATVPVPATGGWEVFANATAPAEGASGVHDLYLVFRAPPAGPSNATTMLFNVNSWAFGGGAAAGGSAPPPQPAIRVALRSRATGAFVTAKADGSPLTAAASVAGPPQTFTVINNEDGS